MGEELRSETSPYNSDRAPNEAAIKRIIEASPVKKPVKLKRRIAYTDGITH